MDLRLPATVLCRPALASTLAVLSGTTRPLAGREVARLAPHGSVPAVFDALHQLVDHGLVVRQEVGRTHLYRLNHEHVAATAALELARLRQTLLDRIQGAIADWRVQPVNASLFGSAARGDGTVESDIDVLIVRAERTSAEDPRWREQLDSLGARLLRWSGNQARWLELSRVELTRMVRRHEPIVADWREEALDLAGKPLRSLLRVTK
jgi:predicted nucleotidyltransferase